MKKITIIIIYLISICVSNAQVSIGTTNPDSNSALEIESTTGALVPPRMTTTQMNLITPIEGAIVYNTTDDSMYLYTNGSWTPTSRKPIIVLNRAGGAISTINNTFFNFPLGSSHVLVNDTDVYTIISDGSIRINKTGTYLFNGSFSSSNVPSGSKKYIILVRANGTIIGYLNRGYTNIPSGTDYWGTSGVLVYPITANDVIDFQYVFNNSGVSLNAVFFNLSISKI